MSDINSIQNTINNWLLDEGLTVSKIDDPNADFHLVVSNAFKLGFGIDIVKLTNKPIIILGMAANFSPEIKSGLLKLNETEGGRFLLGLQKELLKFEIEHAIKPSKIDPARIEITGTVYIDELNRTSFMEMLKRIKYAALFFVWSITQKISPSKGPSGSPSAYG